MSFNNGISIIGTGNVAWHLSVAFSHAQIKINKVIGRDLIKAKELAGYISCGYDKDIASIPKNTDLVLLCVSDNAIGQIVPHVKHLNVPIAHTAASIPLSVFPDNTQSGVFYPFQTFTKNIRMGKLEIPIFIEAVNEKVFILLEKLGRAISESVIPLNSGKRKLLHIAGIMVNNFSNYFFSRAFGFLDRNEINSDFLLPLIRETINKLDYGSPEELQTGPAKRGSIDIVREHQQLIKDDELQELYRFLSESIMEYYKK